MTDAGHLLGSASVTLRLTEGDVTKTLVFSGDIGSPHRPIIRDPQYLTEADYVVMESTYGNREHDKVEDYRVELAKVIDDTLSQGGNVVIPSFAVGRTQELLYLLREIKEQGLVAHHPDFPVYVDSPLSAPGCPPPDTPQRGWCTPSARGCASNGGGCGRPHTYHWKK